MGIKSSVGRFWKVWADAIEALSGTLGITGNVTVSGNTTVAGNLTVAGTQTVTGATTQTGLQTFAVMPVLPTATVAATGNSQATAAAIATGFTLVTAADATKAVRLPTASAGLVCIVKNGANAVLPIFPATSDKVNALAANASLNIAALSSVMLVSYDAEYWYSLPLLPS